MARWAGRIPAGRTLTGIQAHMDLFTTLAAAAGVPDVVEKVRQDRKQIIDGVNNLDYWTGKSAQSKRESFIYLQKGLTIDVNPMLEQVPKGRP